MHELSDSSPLVENNIMILFLLNEKFPLKIIIKKEKRKNIVDQNYHSSPTIQ